MNTHPNNEIRSCVLTRQTFGRSHQRPAHLKFISSFLQQTHDASDQRLAHLKFLSSSHSRPLITLTSVVRISKSYLHPTGHPWRPWSQISVIRTSSSYCSHRVDPLTTLTCVQHTSNLYCPHTASSDCSGQLLGHLKFISAPRHSSKENVFLSSPALVCFYSPLSDLPNG